MSFQCRLKCSIPDQRVQHIPEVRGIHTEGSVSHFRKISHELFQKISAGGAKTTRRLIIGEELRYVDKGKPVHEQWC